MQPSLRTGGEGLPLRGGWSLLGSADEGTFSFEEIYNLLVPHLKPERKYVDDISVSLICGVSPEGMPFGGGGRLEDPETIGTLIRLIRDKMGIRDTGQMDDMFQKRPLFPGYDADGTPILGYIRKPYVPMEVCDDPFADNPKQPQTADDEPKDDGTATPPPQPAVQEKPPEPPAVIPPEPAVAQTPVIEDEPPADVAEDEPSEEPSKANYLWLYIAIALCALVAIPYFLRRKKREVTR